jgi:hypothetical protein
MPGEPLYRQRLKILRALFAEDVRRMGEAMAIGRISAPYTEAELARHDEHMQRHLHCSLPVCYANLLREFGGARTMGTWLCGMDEPNDQDPGNWPVKGSIYATLSWVARHDRKEVFTSPWIVIGESDVETFAISRDGKRFGAFDTAGGASKLPRTEPGSLDALLCLAMDGMIRAARPTIVG